MLLISFLFFSQLSFGKMMTPYTESEKEVLFRQGELVSVKMTLGKPLKFFILSRERASFDPSTLKVTMRRLDPLPQKNFLAQKHEDYYTILGAENEPTLNEIQVTTQSYLGEETFNFKVNTKIKKTK